MYGGVEIFRVFFFRAQFNKIWLVLSVIVECHALLLRMLITALLESVI